MHNEGKTVANEKNTEKHLIKILMIFPVTLSCVFTKQDRQSLLTHRATVGTNFYKS